MSYKGRGADNEIKPGRSATLSSRIAKHPLPSAKEVGQSQSKFSRKYCDSHSTMDRILKAPVYTSDQLDKIPANCRALRVQHFTHGKYIIMDGEKYFSFSKCWGVRTEYFYVLMWIAISSKGISAAHIQPSRSPAVNTAVYVDKCLPKLKQFIDEKHAQDKIIFWPNLGRSHYAKKSLEWLKSEKIEFVPKNDNPPNLPQARPIENLWAILSRKVYENGWEAQSHEQLISRIKSKMNEINVLAVQSMMDNVKSKLHEIEINGAYVEEN